MKNLFEALQAASIANPFDQTKFDAAFAAVEEAGLELESGKAQAIATAVQQANEAKDAETKGKIEKIVGANKQALDAKDTEITELKTQLSNSEQAREAETARANGLHTQLNDANTAHAAQISALNTDLTNARQAATNAANSRDALCTDLDTWNKEVNPDATDINKNTNNPVALVKGNIAAKAIADAKAKGPEAPKPDNAPQAPNASWSKGRLFALVGAGVLAGCVIGAVAYNNSSTLQSCYKFCADSKVGCKLADLANFICKFFTRSSSAEISR